MSNKLKNKNINKDNLNNIYPKSYKNKKIRKTDYDIPGFNFKSSLIILCSAVFSVIIAPFLFQQIGFNSNLVLVICNTFITSFAVSYVRFFIETNRGFCKKFWNTYIIFSISCFIISFCWVYLNTYI